MDGGVFFEIDHHNTSSSRRFDRDEFLVGLVVALRSVICVGIGCVFLDLVPKFNVYVKSYGWLLLFWSFCFGGARFPLAEFFNVLPGASLCVAFCFAMSAICSTFQSVGYWAFLSGGLIFISSTARLWVYYPSVFQPSFFTVPFVFITFANNAGIDSNPVYDVGGPISVALLLALLIALCMCVIPPNFAWLVMRRRYGAVCRMVAKSFACDTEDLRTFCLVLEGKRQVESLLLMLDSVQLELFFCSVSGYKQRLMLLRQLLEMRSEDQVAAQWILKLQDRCDEAPTTLQSSAQHALVTFDGWNEPFVRPSLDFIKGCVWTLLRGAAFARKHFATLQEYVTSIEFKFRVANMIAGSVAVTFASLFVLIPSWRSYFSNPIWPAVSVGVLWSNEQFPDLNGVYDRIVGIVIAGFPFYAILLWSGVSLSNAPLRQAIGLSLMFLFLLLFHSRRGLQKACVLMLATLMEQAPPNASGLTDWVVERLLLNLLGGLIVLIGRMVLWFMFPATFVFVVHLDRCIQDAIHVVRGKPKTKSMQFNRKSLESALHYAEQNGHGFLYTLPIVKYQNVVKALDKVFNNIDNQSIEQCILCLTQASYVVRSQLALVLRVEKVHRHSNNPLMQSCVEFRDAIIATASELNFQQRASQMMK